MQIIKNYIIKNEYSRPGKKLQELRGVVMHWTANPAASAEDNRDFFNNRRTGLAGYGSAHYIVDTDGHIVAAIPEDEIAYHCGTSKIDPASNRVYTDAARTRFGCYAHNPALSPNLCTIGVELCPLDMEGTFSDATIAAAVELVADICKRHELNPEDIVRHYDVVGWKDCPRLWVNKPELFEAFKLSVADALARGI